MSLSDFATDTASTKRPPTVSSGKRGVPAAHLSGVSITPLMPASEAVQQHPALQSSATEIWETYTYSHAHTDDDESVTQLPDINAGDIMTVDSTDYDVLYVGDWPAAGGVDAYLMIALQEVKNR